MPVSGAVNLRSPWVASTRGAPQRMNRNDGRKVKKVAIPAPAIPASSGRSGPKTCWVEAPMKPTKATTMMSGPGVVSPSARPWIIWLPVSQP